MVPVNVVITIAVLIVVLMFFPFIFLALIHQMTSGKMLCGIVSKGKPLRFKMKKIVDGEFVQEDKDQWFIREPQVKLVNYPIMFPKFLGFLQRIVPCELVTPGRSEPLDWEDPGRGIMSSTELEAVLDPHWLRALVQGAVEGGGKSDKQQRMFTLLAMALSGICMILLFVVMYKVGALQSSLTYLQSLLKVK